MLCGERVLVLYKRINGELRLPKGNLDAAEEPAAAALREVREETGFAGAQIIADLGETEVRFVTIDGVIERQEHYFAMRLADFGRVARGRKDAFRFAVRWLTVTEALEQLTFESERAAVQRALTATDVA